MTERTKDEKAARTTSEPVERDRYTEPREKNDPGHKDAGQEYVEQQRGGEFVEQQRKDAELSNDAARELADADSTV